MSKTTRVIKGKKIIIKNEKKDEPKKKYDKKDRRKNNKINK